MNTPQEIYSSPWLKSKAEAVVKQSIKDLESEQALAKEFANMALTDAERAGCEDLDYLDFLYLKQL